MVPIHDTDVANERWAKAEWENYELWEKVEVRLRRQKRLWILATTFVFLVLSALPIVLDRWPKWTSRSILGQVVRQINQVKRESGVMRASVRLRFLEPQNLTYVVEKVANCSATTSEEVIRKGNLSEGSFEGHYIWVDPKTGVEQGVPGLVNEFCYDFLAGSGASSQGKDVVGFAVLPVKDLNEKRLDRMSILLLSGPSAEVSFD